jgi:transposase
MKCRPVIDSGGAGMTGKKQSIRTDLHTASELRAMACGKASPRKVKRLLALANALDGMSFTDAATAAGMERQALSDAVKRYNAEGTDGLEDRPRSGRRRRLDVEQERMLAAIVLTGPDPEQEGISAYTLDDLCAIVKQRFSVEYGPTGVSAVLHRLGFSRQKARPYHPKKDEAAQAAFKGGFRNG